MKILTKKETAEFVTGVVLTGSEFMKLVDENLSGWIDINLPNIEEGEWSVSADEITITGDVTIMFDATCDQLPKVIPKPTATKKKTTAKRKTK